MPTDSTDVTLLLNRVANGETEAREELLSRVYDSLRQIARKRMAGERDDHTLEATELVHEAYLKMAGELGNHEWTSRGHFFTTAAEAMRRILIDHARRKGRQKRGDRPIRVGTNVLDLAEAEENSESILALDRAFRRLEQQDARLAQVVRLRFFAGLSTEETAAAMGVSKRTVIRDWVFARAWLFDRLHGENEGQS